MMIDAILLTFFLIVWYGGFWCGAKYGTLRNLKAAAVEKVKAWLGR